MRWIAILVAAATLADNPAPAVAQVCRSGALATVTCLEGPVSPPMPRPLRSDVQALDKVLREAPATGRAPEFTPSWRVNRFGDVVGPAGGGLGPGCRADSFGNLRCP